MKALLLAFFVLIGLAFWFQDHPLVRDRAAWVRKELGISTGQATPARAQFITATVETGELRRIVTATGTLNATINVEVGSQLSGQIAEILVDFNDRVHQGEPLARLDQKSFQARADEAEAALEVAKVTVSTARV